MEPLFELGIALPPAGSRDRMRALHNQLRTAIVEGRLRPGMRLPPTRAMAAAYGVSRNTAVATYDLLLSEGYVSARHGAGTFVADVLPQGRERRRADVRDPSPRQRLNAYWRDAPASWDESPGTPFRWDFRLGLPDRHRFPFAVWRRMSGRALRAMQKAPWDYGDARGQPALREAIARHVSFTRAVASLPADIVVTQGSQQAFDLLARILVTPGRTVVAIEDPGYLPMRAALSAAGAKIVPVPVDAEGLVVDRIPRSARVVCVTPSHQFPLGVAMSMPRRAALLDFAQAHGASIIEDDYDGEFRFGGRPLDALQTLDRAAAVFYVGTFSKSLFPAIRLGFIAAPEWAHRSLAAAKLCADRRSDSLTQDTLALFMSEGHLARHVRKMRRVYHHRREVLLQALRTELGHVLEPVPSTAGLHMSAVGSGGHIDAVAQRAREEGIGVSSLRHFHLGKPTQQGLVFGYGALEETAIPEGIARLRKLWKR
jgi:GntR family transcriptional regulator/MocR family aminotransferase